MSAASTYQKLRSHLANPSDLWLRGGLPTLCPSNPGNWPDWRNSRTVHPSRTTQTLRMYSANNIRHIRNVEVGGSNPLTSTYRAGQDTVSRRDKILQRSERER